MPDKKADLAGPGIGDYVELEKILPRDYSSRLTVKDTQKAIFAAKNFIEEHLCQALNLMMVTVPLIVDTTSGVNDMLDRDVDVLGRDLGHDVHRLRVDRLLLGQRVGDRETRRQLDGAVLQ